MDIRSSRPRHLIAYVLQSLYLNSYPTTNTIDFIALKQKKIVCDYIGQMLFICCHGNVSVCDVMMFLHKCVFQYVTNKTTSKYVFYYIFSDLCYETDKILKYLLVKHV